MAAPGGACKGRPPPRGAAIRRLLRPLFRRRRELLTELGRAAAEATGEFVRRGIGADAPRHRRLDRHRRRSGSLAPAPPPAHDRRRHDGGQRVEASAGTGRSTADEAVPRAPCWRGWSRATPSRSSSSPGWSAGRILASPRTWARESSPRRSSTSGTPRPTSCATRCYADGRIGGAMLTSRLCGVLVCRPRGWRGTEDRGPHSHRPSRKAKRRSLGRKRRLFQGGTSRRLSASSFMLRSASR